MLNNALPLFAAKLVTTKRLGSSHRPALYVRFWDPIARAHVERIAPDNLTPETILPTDDRSGKSVLVQLDPDEVVRDRLALVYFRERLGAWLKEQAFAGCSYVVAPPVVDSRVAGPDGGASQSRRGAS